MAFSSSKLPSSIVVPAHWTPPLYQFNERVEYIDKYSGYRTGLIRGIEFVETPDEYGCPEKIETGWHYDVLIDKDMPDWKITPKVILHETALKSLVNRDRLVTVHARRNREKITVICRR